MSSARYLFSWVRTFLLIVLLLGVPASPSALAAPLSGSFKGLGDAFLRFSPLGAELIRRINGAARVSFSEASYLRALERLGLRELAPLRLELEAQLETVRLELTAERLRHGQAPDPLSVEILSDAEMSLIRRATAGLDSVQMRELVAGALKDLARVGPKSLELALHGNFQSNSRRFALPPVLERAGQLQEALWAYREMGDFEAAARVEGRLLAIFGKGKILALRPLAGSSTGSSLITFDTGIRGVFKPDGGHVNTDVGAEVATYRADSLLGSDRVPLTITARIHGRVGSLQYYVKNAGVTPYDAPEDPEINVLDLLLGHEDRPRNKNSLTFLSLGIPRRVAIDNSLAFDLGTAIPPFASDRLSARLRWAQILAHMPGEVARTEFGAWVGDDRIRAFLARRKSLLDGFLTKTTIDSYRQTQ